MASNSFPKDRSVNDGIKEALCSLTYVGVGDAAIRGIVDRGHYAQLAKVDVKSAYRNIPVHPDDLRYALFVDAALPFGRAEDLHSSGKRSRVDRAKALLLSG